MQARTIPMALVSLALASGVALAEDGRRTGAAPTLHGELALSLGDAIKMGLENNLDVEVQRHEPLIAGEDVDIAWGVFDPEFFSELFYVDRRTPEANPLLAGGTGGTVAIRIDRSLPEGEGGLRGELPLLGTEYSLGFSGNETTTNNAFAATLLPQNASGLSLSVTQPLLRDLIWNRSWTTVQSNKISAQASLEGFRTEVMDVVESIEKAYWDLVANDDQVRVAEKSLETSQALLEQTQTQYEVGVVSKVEVVESEAGVAEREFSLIQARNTYRNSQDVLIDLVLGAGLRAESSLEITPTERPDDYIPYEIDVQAAVAKAFESRPELAEARREIERQQVQLKFAKNQRLPALDFVVDWGPQGIAGALNPNSALCQGTFGPPPAECFDIPPPATGFGDTFDTWGAAQSLTVGGRLSVPIPNRSARGTVSKTELELRRAKTLARRVEQNIVIEVRERARNLEAAQEGIEAAERRRIAAEEQLRAERIRLEYGESTPFDVLLRERDLVEAENQKIGALQVYRNSVTELDRAQGTILANRNIRIDQVSDLRLDVR